MIKEHIRSYFEQDVCEAWYTAMKATYNNFNSDYFDMSVLKNTAPQEETTKPNSTTTTTTTTTTTMTVPIESARWCWKDDDNRWKAYTAAEAQKIQQNYEKGVNKFELTVNGKQYIINIGSMTQENISTGFKHKISNTIPTEISAAWFWINDNGQEFPYSDFDCAKIEDAYKKKLPHVVCQLKRYKDDIPTDYMIVFSPVTCETTKKIYSFGQKHPKTGYTRGVIRKELTKQVQVIQIPNLPEKLVNKPKSKTVTIQGLPSNINDAVKDVKNLIARLHNTKTVKLNITQAEISQVEQEFNVTITKKTDQSLEIRGIYDVVAKAYQSLLQMAANKGNTNIFPVEWAPQTTDVHLEPLASTNPEYMVILNLMRATMPTVKLVKMERIQSKHLWSEYFAARETLRQANKGNANEMLLFHGTRSTAPEVIYKGKHGFDFRHSAEGMWGRGSYFAVNASYSHGYAHPVESNLRQFFVAKVAIGEAKDMPPNNSLKMPPPKETSDGTFSVDYYDSVTGITGGSRIYIVYETRKAYPAYLITYQAQ